MFQEYCDGVTNEANKSSDASQLLKTVPLRCNSGSSQIININEYTAMKYVANPVTVDAFKIEIIDLNRLMLENGSIVEPTPEMLARITPTVGDYYVVQADGYIYLNPKDVFERKYSPMTS